MDLNQRKLNKSEWESIEVPVTDDEKYILTLICKGYHDVNIKYNKHISLFGYLKVEFSLLMEDYLYYNYFLEKINKINTYTDYVHDINANPKIKKALFLLIVRYFYSSSFQTKNYAFGSRRRRLQFILIKI